MSQENGAQGQQIHRNHQNQQNRNFVPGQLAQNHMPGRQAQNFIPGGQLQRRNTLHAPAGPLQEQDDPQEQNRIRSHSMRVPGTAGPGQDQIDQQGQNQIDQQGQNQVDQQGQNQAGQQGQNQAGQQGQNQIDQPGQLNQPGDDGQQILQHPQQERGLVRLKKKQLWRMIAAGEQTQTILNYQSPGNHGEYGAAGFEKAVRSQMRKLTDNVAQGYNAGTDQVLGS